MPLPAQLAGQVAGRAGGPPQPGHRIPAGLRVHQPIQRLRQPRAGLGQASTTPGDGRPGCTASYRSQPRESAISASWPLMAAAGRDMEAEPVLGATVLAAWITSGTAPPGMEALSPDRFGPLPDTC